MSETEKPPAKLLKTDNEDGNLTDATEVSNMTDASETAETTEIPEVSAPEKANIPEVTNMQESLEMAEGISMDMVEERLQDSLESQEAPESQEGQEEWLSEDVLTDDDFNPAIESAPDSQTSQPETTLATDSPIPSNIKPEQTEQAIIDAIPKEIEAKAPEQNIEDALNTLEGGPEKEEDIPDLDAFLIKKTSIKPDEAQPKPEDEKQEPDDGNDTDDLLRMLGEDGSKPKKLTKTVKDVRTSFKAEAGSSDDDEFDFEGASAKKPKLATSLPKKIPPKAIPEDMDEDGTDLSSDEADMMKKMFTNKKSNQKSLKQDIKPTRFQEANSKSIVSVVEKPKKERLVTSTPLKAARARSLLKAPQEQAVQVKREPHHHTYSRSKNSTKVATPLKSTSILKLSVKQEPKIEPKDKDEEEILGEEFHLAEESESEFDELKMRQRIMKPERMNEDELSEPDSYSEDGSLYDPKQMDGGPSADSCSEDGSLYDELPSSESEDAEDWFQLDIRAEKAGDYLPLLGPKAKQMLLEEKKRVAERLANLKQSLSALTDSGKKQAEQVRTATMTLAELDDMLKAS